MPDFPHVPHALRTPTRCVACETNRSEAGFLDLVREIPGYGRLYLCASCVEQAAVKVGCLSAKVAGEMRQAADDDRAEIGRLNGQLVFEREHKTVSKADIAEWLNATDGGDTPLEIALSVDPLKCPDCGNAKTAGAKRCKPCANKIPSTVTA